LPLGWSNPAQSRQPRKGVRKDALPCAGEQIESPRKISGFEKALLKPCPSKADKLIARESFSVAF